MTTEDIRKALEALFDDPQMITKSIYSPTAVTYPDGQLPFVEYHLQRLSTNKSKNPETYLSNLRLMIKKR